MDDPLKIGAAELSRRSILQNLAFTAGGATILGTTAGGIRPAAAQTKVAQTLVGYQDTPKGDQRCDNCAQFEAPSSCKVVDGAIAAGGWCKVYVKKPA
jgi:hypothetical protein